MTTATSSGSIRSNIANVHLNGFSSRDEPGSEYLPCLAYSDPPLAAFSLPCSLPSSLPFHPSGTSSRVTDPPNHLDDARPACDELSGLGDDAAFDDHDHGDRSATRGRRTPCLVASNDSKDSRSTGPSALIFKCAYRCLFLLSPPTTTGEAACNGVSVPLRLSDFPLSPIVMLLDARHYPCAGARARTALAPWSGTEGPLGPHVSNLPRRPRVPPLNTLATLRISTSPCSPCSRGASTATSYAPSPIQIPSLPLLPFPIADAGGIQIPQQQQLNAYRYEYEYETHDDTDMDIEPVEPVGPTYANVPRRTVKLATITAPVIAGRRRRQRPSMQELGLGRGPSVFVAFEESTGAGKDADQARFDAVVRIKAPDATGDADAADVPQLQLVARGTRDDGVPSLEPAQLRAACAFVCEHREREGMAGKRVLITAPREHAVDAFCVALGAIVFGTMSGSRSREAWSTADGDAERMHRVMVRWHDFPVPVEGQDGDGGETEGGDSRLRDDWRGLLSRNGIEYLAAALLGSTSPSRLRLRPFQSFSACFHSSISDAATMLRRLVGTTRSFISDSWERETRTYTHSTTILHLKQESSVVLFIEWMRGAFHHFVSKGTYNLRGDTATAARVQVDS
ncbi:hypothetical protein K438DRAFT_1771014 [Mycena galopus ATCC 62051]|nr:hypothetical protein K438DRAFT_1771014 [Mycena galopus ATCC 62051]